MPGARLLHKVLLDGRVEDRAFLRDALAIDDVELGLSEGRRELVLDHLDLGVDADRLRAVLDRLLPADVETNGGIELESPAPRRGRRAARGRPPSRSR